MADTIQVTPQMLRSTANDIQANMEQAMGIAKGYLANQENVMTPPPGLVPASLLRI